MVFILGAKQAELQSVHIRHDEGGKPKECNFYGRHILKIAL